MPPHDLPALIRTIRDFPKPAIRYRDITPLLATPGALGQVIDAWAAFYADAGVERVLAIESRGFLFGAPLAIRLGAGLVLLRKAGKLPAETIGHEHDLEYGTSRLEMHVDGVVAGQRVLLVDDVLATGGTMEAAWKLAKQAGAEVLGAAVLIELTGLPGRQRLAGLPIQALMELPA